MQPTTLYEIAKNRYYEINIFLQQLEKRLEKYPKGKIHVVQHGIWTQYYLRTDPKDKSGKYISKHEKEKIRLYLQKKYDQEVIAHLKLEKSNLEEFINKSNFDSIAEIKKIYSANPTEVKKIINPIDISDTDYMEEWLNEKFECKEINSQIFSLDVVNLRSAIISFY